MIFISHTKKDKPIIEPIAIRLAEIYGDDKVFYDSWSIQPGDGIIDQMNHGLEKCKFFFIFVSKNSLQSNMVSLEWQNAILKAVNGDVKFIPVKLDDCLMPAILMQSLYIDIFGQGLEVAIRQMIDVINGQNTFRPQYKTFENVRGYVTKENDGSYIIEFRAECYLEPISNYCVLIDNDLDNINIISTSDSMRMTNEQAGVKTSNGETHNALFEGVTRGTAPNFPYRVCISTKNGEPIKLAGLMRAISENNYQAIPYTIQ